jgi:hypothetical protein
MHGALSINLVLTLAKHSSTSAVRRSFSTSSRGVKNRGDSFKRRFVVPSSGAVPAQPSSLSSTGAEPSGRCSQQQQQHAVLGISLSFGGVSSLTSGMTSLDLNNGGKDAYRSVAGQSADSRLSAAESNCCHRVTVIGDPDVGKRSIVRQTMTSEYMHGNTDSSPTNGKSTSYFSDFMTLLAHVRTPVSARCVRFGRSRAVHRTT